MLQLDNFYKARFVLSKVIRKTELVHTPRINPESDVYLKPECLQKTGSFKIRGAYYKISQLTDEEKAELKLYQKLASACTPLACEPQSPMR